MRYVSLDFETFSEADIRECGVHVYARHPSTEVLIACYSLDEGQTVQSWQACQPAPKDLFDAIAQGRRIRAFNADFEELIWTHVCVPMGWPEVPESAWHDTMALCHALSLPGSLEAAANALELPIKKNKEGRRLITKFSKPRNPTKSNPSHRICPQDDPADFAKFVSYCADDVRVECAIFDAVPLKELRGMESAVYEQNRLLNKRGVVLDVSAFRSVQRMIDRHRAKRISQLQSLTQGEVQTEGQRDKFIAWAATQGVILEGFTKDDLARTLDLDLPENVREAIEIRLELSQVSTKKYDKMGAVCCKDGRARGNLTYHRASTGRNGGSGLQLHNFPRDYVSTNESVIQDCIDFIGREQYELTEALYGGTLLDVAKGLLRNMVIAPPGQRLYVADFAGVENRGTAWVARDPVGLKVFRDGRDQYREFAAAQFRITPEQVSAEQRTAAKATILGAIFGSGWKTIYETNVQRGIPMTEEEAQRNVTDFRRIYAETTKTWYDLERNSREAIRTRTDKVYKQIRFGVRRDFFFIGLPSGRALAYHKPRIEPVMTPWGEEKIAVTFMGLSSKKQWIRMTLTPNRLIENIVSAICRDLLMYCQLEIEKDGRVTPVLNVHDEIVSYGDPDAISLHEYEQLMERTPDWATNDQGITFPLKAEGYIAKRYRK